VLPELPGFPELSEEGVEGGEYVLPELPGFPELSEEGVEGGEYVLPELPGFPELSEEGEEGRLDVLIYNNRIQNKIYEIYKSNTN